MTIFISLYYKQEYPDLFEYLIILSNVCSLKSAVPGFLFHTRQVITMRNPLGVAPRWGKRFRSLIDIKRHSKSLSQLIKVQMTH